MGQVGRGAQVRYLFLLLFAPALVAQEPVLRWGGDKSGGAPFLFEDGTKLSGFEAEIAEDLGRRIGRKPEFVQVNWPDLRQTMLKGEIDVCLNGLEFVAARDKATPSTLPYFVYTLRLIVAKDNNSIRDWADLKKPINGRKPRIGVLTDTLAHRFAESEFGDVIEIVPSTEVDGILKTVQNGDRLDATIQDSPAAIYYVDQGHADGLKIIGDARDTGYYVVLTRPDDTKLRDELNTAIKGALADGTLEKIYRKYDLWSGDQERLAYRHLRPWPPEIAEGDEGPPTDRPSLWDIRGKIARAAGNTIALALISFPLAIIGGLKIAMIRLFLPKWISWPFSVYVEVIRGTPMLLQFFVLFFMLPELAKASGVGWLMALANLPPFVVGVIGLAMNYSAYEAEIYRGGFLAVPRGQMEAALALGMSKAATVRRILLPQAFRIVIPPVTNDFINMFKDTSICSVILVTELTSLYYQYKQNDDIMLPLAFTVATLYFLMSWPLSLISRRLETKHQPVAGG